MNVISETLRAH